MSSSANPQHEPTMEEILASIRKIISEDQPQAAPAAPPPPPPRSVSVVEPAPAPAPQQVSDVLELTEEVRDEQPPAPAPAPPPEPARVIENDIAFETIDAKAGNNMDQDDLISDSTRSAMGRAFASLDDEPRGYSAPAGGTLDALFLRAVTDAFVPTLKDWVDDHHAEVMSNLKPLIRAWMDEHLPHLIETAVTKEIARAAAERPRRR